jgi:hypothetical protein
MRFESAALVLRVLLRLFLRDGRLTKLRERDRVYGVAFLARLFCIEFYRHTIKYIEGSFFLR